MKRILLLVMAFSTVLLVACTSADQKAYEEALEEAKEKISAEAFEEAEVLLKEALSTDYEKDSEAENLLDQLQQYQSLEALLKEGKFTAIYQRVDDIKNHEDGSSVISEKAEAFKIATEKKEKAYKQIKAKVDEALKLAKANKYAESNKQLKAIESSDREASYYDDINALIKETLKANDEQIAKDKNDSKQEEAEGKEESESDKEAESNNKDETNNKQDQEATGKNGKLTWTDQEITQYMANHFRMPEDYLIIMAGERSNSGYSIEVRQDNAAAGVGDPNVSTALGFFEVRANGKLYEMDIMSGDYILID